MDEYITIGLDDGREIRYPHIKDFRINRDENGKPMYLYFKKTDTVSTTMVAVYLDHVMYYERKVKED